MVKHIVLWNFKEELSASERSAAAKRIKEELEAIKPLMEGIDELQVICNEMDSSNRDIALISTFSSKDALAQYQIHPAHVQAGSFIKSVTENRTCMDYEL